MGVLQLVRLGVDRVGHPHGHPLLAAPRPPVEDRADLALPQLPRLDARRARPVGLGVARRRSSSCWRRTPSRRPRTPTSARAARRSRRSSSRSPRSRTRSRPAAPTTSPPSSASRSRGASGAAIVPPDGYFERAARGLRPLRGAADLRRDHHRLRAHRHLVRRAALGLQPDIVTFAKGVTSGMLPFSGHGGGGPRGRRLHGRADGFPWGHTFSGYPLGCAVAAEAIRTIRDEDVLANVAAMGARLEAGLREIGAPLADRRPGARPRPAAGARAGAGPRDAGAAGRRLRRVTRGGARAGPDDLLVPDAVGRRTIEAVHARAPADRRACRI